MTFDTILADLGTGIAMVPIVAILEQVAIAKAFCKSRRPSLRILTQVNLIVFILFEKTELLRFSERREDGFDPGDDRRWCWINLLFLFRMRAVDSFFLPQLGHVC